MTTTVPSEEALTRIQRHLGRHHALYAPSVVAEAAVYLDELLAVAGARGIAADTEAAGWLTTAAAESISARYGGRPVPERTITELRALTDALWQACKDAGLAASLPDMGGSGVAADPVPGGPTWGIAKTGLAVKIYLDGGWDLAVNRPGSQLISVYAPATAEGAAEVIAIMADILHGRAPDPFRR